MRFPFILSIVFSIFLGVIVWMLSGNIYVSLLLSSIMQLCFTVYGASYIRSGFFIKTLNVIPAGNMRLVLSFDDGPDKHTDGIIQVLNKYQVQAVFFLIGKKVVGKEEQVRRLDYSGHLIGNHTTVHQGNFYFWSSKKMLKDIENNNSQIKKIIGKSMTYFRPPFGVTNPSLSKAIRNTKMAVVGWSFRTLDTVRTPDRKMESRILKNIKDGDIILFHDTTNGIVEFLDRLIPLLMQKGFNFVLLPHHEIND